MTDECQVTKLLIAYPVDNTLLASDMSEDDVQALCGRYGLEEGEYLLAFYGRSSLRSYENGVVITDRRVVSGEEKFSRIGMNIQSFPWDDLRFVLDDIKAPAMSNKVILPNGQFIRVGLSSGKFYALMKKVASALETFNGESGVQITAQMKARAQDAWDAQRDCDAAADKESVKNNLKFLKWMLIAIGVILAFVAAEKFFQYVQSMSQSKGQFTDKEICRAGIAVTAGKPLSIVKPAGASEDFYRFTYVREKDQTRWSFRCKVEGDRVVWATSNGPWRTRDSDWPIYWYVDDSGNVLNVLEDYLDGSGNKETFRKSDF